MRLASFPWSGSSNEFGAIFQCLLAMKGALLPSETLANNLCIFINIEMFPRSCIGTMPDSILLQEEGARQEAGGREATAAGGHGRAGSCSSKGCGHPPMTLPGPRGLAGGRGLGRTRVARAVA